MLDGVKGTYLYTFGKLRNLYEYVLSWADKKYANLALFVLAFIESSFFPMPPDLLQMALSFAKPKRSYLFATVALIGSVLGGIFGYVIGVFLFDTVGQAIITTLGYEAQFTTVGELFKQYAYWAIVVAAFTPIPYKVFTIGAGVWGIGLIPLVLASIVGRGLRFFAVATLIFFFGPKVKEFIEKYFNLLTLLFMLLLIGGFILVRYLA